MSTNRKRNHQPPSRSKTEQPDVAGDKTVTEDAVEQETDTADVEPKKPEAEPVIPAKVFTAEDTPTNTRYGEVFQQHTAAFDLKVRLMETHLGPGKLYPSHLAGELQRGLQEVIVNLITKVPPNEVRAAIGYILDTYHSSPFFKPSCMLKGIVNQGTGKPYVSDWYKRMIVIFSMTADPAVRFKVIGVRANIESLGSDVPVLILTRLKDFYIK